MGGEEQVALEDLKPCPNPACEGDVESLEVARDPLNTSRWYGCIHCDWCGTTGPTGKGIADAVRGWNSLPR